MDFFHVNFNNICFSLHIESWLDMLVVQMHKLLVQFFVNYIWSILNMEGYYTKIDFELISSDECIIHYFDANH